MLPSEDTSLPSLVTYNYEESEKNIRYVFRCKWQSLHGGNIINVSVEQQLIRFSDERVNDPRV